MKRNSNLTKRHGSATQLTSLAPANSIPRTAGAESPTSAGTMGSPASATLTAAQTATLSTPTTPSSSLATASPSTPSSPSDISGWSGLSSRIASIVGAGRWDRRRQAMPGGLGPTINVGAMPGGTSPGLPPSTPREPIPGERQQ